MVENNLCELCGSPLLSTGECVNLNCNNRESSVKHYYYLMNKDSVIAKFNVQLDTQRLTVDEVYTPLPNWLSVDLAGFIRNRKAPKHRENMQHLLDMTLKNLSS